jgi:hypothetical protein
MFSLLVSTTHNQFSGLIVILFCAAAWVGIQYLEYPEFAMAGRMFLKGKFRQIIDVETRLLDFERALAQAADPEECWIKVLAGTREFGFQGVRMNLSGVVFEDLGSRNGHPFWQLRIPLPEAQYVNFYRDFKSEMNPLIISAFVSSVERGLTTSVGWGLKAQAPRRGAEVIRIPAAASLFYTAAAGDSNGIVAGANGD